MTLLDVIDLDKISTVDSMKKKFFLSHGRKWALAWNLWENFNTKKLLKIKKRKEYDSF